MSKTFFPPLDITAQWGRLNESIVSLVDYVPEDKLEWSPREDLWNFKGILLHTIMTRDSWLDNAVKDGQETPNVLELAQTKYDMKNQLRRSWERLQPFLRDAAKLSTEYETPRGTVGGHWIAFHLLEHDIHHRSDIFHYLALLGIEHPEVGTP